MHLTAALERVVRRSGDKVAVVYGDEEITYAELADRARRAASVFIDRGVRPGDRVAVMTYNSPGFLIAAFGAWYAGAVLVPVNHKFAAPEVNYAIDHSGAVLGVVSGDLASTASAGATGITWLTTGLDADGFADFDALVSAAEPLAAAASGDEDDPAQILYTSGTTSSPKGCVHTHRTITSLSPLLAASLNLTPEVRFLIAMPIWHSAPLNCWAMTTLWLGGTVVLMREYHPAQFLPTVVAKKVTAFFGSPIAYLLPLQLADAGQLDIDAFDLSAVSHWIYGGASLGEPTARKLTGAYRSESFYQVYGMSEMGPSGTLLYPHEQRVKAGSIGRGAMLGVDLRVVAADGSEQGPGGVGEIWLRGDTRMVEYLDNAEATEEAFVGPWLRTGDVARIDDDGYLFIVDRLKDVIIVGGENVHSQEVEEVLRGHQRLADVAVIGRPHPEWGETVVAVCVTTDGAEITVDELRDFLADKLARYKIPREVVCVPSLPRNPTGKIVKHVLRTEV